MMKALNLLLYIQQKDFLLTPPTGLRKTVSVAEREKLYLENDNLRKEK